MKKTIFGGALAILLTLQSALLFAAGDVLSLKEGHPKTYVVKKGDTLWDISGIFLEDPWRWPQIWHVNPQLDNPHLIYPGDVLNLVYIDGKPRLVVKRGGDIKLSPEVRISSLDRAIPTIPLDQIAPFLSKSRVIQPTDLDGAPYVLAGKSGHILAGAGDELFARGPFEDYDTESFGIFRPGDAFIDPDSEEILGYQAFSVASAKIKQLDGDIATMGLNQTSEEVRMGDRLLPDEDREITTNFEPSPPPEDTDGYIIAVEGGVSQVSSLDVVVLNKGERDGIEIGNVMAIFRAGEVIRDKFTNEYIKVPDERSGLLMVFRTFDKVSYALVLKATGPLKVMDKVKNP